MRRANKPSDADNSTPGLVVWDTQYCAPGEAYTFYQDTMRADDLPWTSKQIDERTFRARAECIMLDGGGVGRLRSVPSELLRTKSEVACSSGEWFCGFYVLSGSVALEQDSRTNLARKGDMLFFDSAQPAKWTNLASGNSLADLMILVFPKALCEWTAAPDRFLVNKHYPRERVLNPLASTLAFISNRLVSSSREELNGLFDAIVDLVPVSVGAFSNGRDNLLQSTNVASLRAVLSFIEDHLSKSTLSAVSAAKELRISERYVYKMFSSAGTTFGAYVMAKRLDRVRADLISPICQRTPISDIAYKWGFNDLSTFNRSFKKRFGCTPKALRE